jgi:hypothetical protein
MVRIIEKLIFWSKCTSYVTMIFGVIAILFGFVQFGFGTILGILLVSTSIAIFKFTMRMKIVLLEQNEENLIEMMRYLLYFFRLHLLSLLVVIILSIMSSIWLIHFLMNWDWIITLIHYGKQLSFILDWFEKIMHWFHK